MSIKNFQRYLCVMLCIFTLAVIVSFFVPATTKQSVNERLIEKPIPLGLKIFELFDRDYHYRQIVKEIVKDRSGADDKMKAIFDWTCTNIRTDFPKEWPVVDDHILNIIVRGYGVGSQTADVFTTLCAYAGFPSAVFRVQAPNSDNRLIVSVVEEGGKFYIFDTIRRNIFYNKDGSIATINDLIADQSIVASAASRPDVAGIAYEDYFMELKPVTRLSTVRPDLQMPWRRLWFEMLKVVGLKHDIVQPVGAKDY